MSLETLSSLKLIFLYIKAYIYIVHYYLFMVVYCDQSTFPAFFANIPDTHTNDYISKQEERNDNASFDFT